MKKTKEIIETVLLSVDEVEKIIRSHFKLTKSSDISFIFGDEYEPNDIGGQYPITELKGVEIKTTRKQ